MIFSIPGCKEAMNDGVSHDAGVAIDWILESEKGSDAWGP